MKEALKMVGIIVIALIISTIGSTLYVILSGMETRDLFTTIAITDTLTLILVLGIGFIFWE